jgi:hypothetical protein
MVHLEKLSALELVTQCKHKIAIERSATAEVIRYLTEIDRRKLYLERAYGSLFEFCIKELHLSESAAQRRIASMRLLKSLTSPDAETIQVELEAGHLSLSHLAAAQRVFQYKKYEEKTELSSLQKSEILQTLKGLSSRESEKHLATLTLKPIPRKEVVYQSSGEIRLSLTVDQETLDLIEQFKAISAHQNPSATMAQTLKIALKTAISRKDPVQAANANGASKKSSTSDVGSKVVKRSRYLSIRLKQQVWQKNAGRCAYIDILTARRCESRYKLEVDHQIAFTKGGDTVLENLQLLCRNHNAAKSG